MPRAAWRGAVAGLAAGAAMVFGMVGGWLPAGLLLAAAITERARTLLPGAAQALIIVRLKFAAKSVGLWSSMLMVVVLAALVGAGLGLVWRRRPWLAALAAAGATAAGLAAFAGPQALAYLVPNLDAQGVDHAGAAALRMLVWSIAGYAALAAVVFGVAMTIGGRRGRGAARPSGQTPAPQAPPASEQAVNRREFLARSIVAAGAAAGATTLTKWLAVAGSHAHAAVAQGGAAAGRAAAAVRSLFQRIKGLPPEVTPNDKFYVVSKNVAGLDPKLDAKKWKLEITGLVGKPVTLTYDDIRAMPSVSRYHTLECISNEVGGDLIGNAMWKGVRFRDLLARAGGVNPTAVRFALRCADGYSEGLPVADAMQPHVMLAYEMNGQPLAPSHGFPTRMLVPGLFGMKNPKWLTKIEAVSTQFTGYWQASGWSDEAVVKTTSQFRVPPDRSRLAGGEVELGGVAYSGDRGIKDVEVSTDGGTSWTQAVVKPPLGPLTWVLWAALWKPTGPGEYTLKVRARDGAGMRQTSAEAATHPDGATGYHTIRIRVGR